MKTQTPLKPGDEVLVNRGTRPIEIRRVQENGVVELAEPVGNQLYWPRSMVERYNPQLGDMLAEIIAQKQAGETKHRVGPKENQKRLDRQKYLAEAAEIIETEIRAGRVPEVGLTSSDLDDWISMCRHHRIHVLDFDLYEAFERRFATQGIEITKTIRSTQTFLTVAPAGAAA